MFLIKEFQHLEIRIEDVISATHNFASSKLIGRGGFGPVYKGELSLHEGRIMVAFKRLDRKFGQGDSEFWKEIMMLSKYKHQNLISLFRFCIEGDERILVYDYASRGSLDRYLGDANLTWVQRLNICLGVANALNYLHDPMGTQQRLIHRDIKSSNILLDEEWNAKVSDFGLSKFGVANQAWTYQVSNAVGTPGYCDPLYHETGLLTKESDVYSFGVVLFELLCGKLCCEYSNGRLVCILVRRWKECFAQERLDDIICHDLKEQITHESLMTFSTIAIQCLDRNHRKRPTMTQIIIKIEAALEQVSNPLYEPVNSSANINFADSPESSQMCDRTAIDSLLQKLVTGDSDEQRSAAGELRLLAKINTGNRVYIAKAGAIPRLVELLSSRDGRTQEHAVSALLNLSRNEDNKGIIVRVGAVPEIVDVLKNGSTGARENAAVTLFSLSVVDEHKVIIGASGAIPPLIDLLQEGTPRGKKDAATAIFNLCIHQGNKVRAVQGGIVTPLMRLLRDASSGMREEALAILALLASHHEGKMAIVEAEPMKVLVELIGTRSALNRENGSAVLWSLYADDVRSLKIMKELGAEEVLKELSENGTDRTKRKAGSVLELLQCIETVKTMVNSS